MKWKIIIIGAVILFLYFAKKKKDKEKEDQQVEVALAENEMPASEQLDIIRLKIDDFLRFNMPFMTDDERAGLVVDITSNLDKYKEQYQSQAQTII
jgi:hypothetical protein